MAAAESLSLAAQAYLFSDVPYGMAGHSSIDAVSPETLVEICTLLEKKTPPDELAVERLVALVGQRAFIEILRHQHFATVEECARVCAVLRTCVQIRWFDDFLGNTDMLVLLEAFLSDMERSVPDAARHCDEVRVETVIMAQQQRRGSTSSAEGNKEPSEVLDFLELQCDPIGIANALKKIDVEHFKKYHVCGNLLSTRRGSLSGAGCPFVGWGRECEGKRAAVHEIRNWSVALVSWVEDIVRQATPQQAKQLVALLISVAKESVERGNFQAVSTIVRGLSSESIASAVQSALAGGHNGKRLKKLKALLDPADDYKAYRAELEKVSPQFYPVVPLIDAIEAVYHQNAPTSMRMPSEDMTNAHPGDSLEASDYVDQTVSRINALRELTILVEKLRAPPSVPVSSPSAFAISVSPPKSILPGRFSVVQKTGSMEGKASEFFARVTLWRFLKESAV